MLRVIVLYAIFISSCVLRAGCQNDVGYGPPRLLFETSDTKQVNANDSFKLECESDGPIYWTYPKHTISPEVYEETGIETVVAIINSKTSTGQHRSVLSVTFANYMDTGNYSCIANDTTDDAASIYVYVKDLEHLLVKNDTFIILPVKQFKAVVIPCRPTSTEVTVTLMREGSEVQPGIQESDSKNVTYDPKIGFTLNPVNFADNGLFTCVAKLEDMEEELMCNFDVLILFVVCYMFRPSSGHLQALGSKPEWIDGLPSGLLPSA